MTLQEGMGGEQDKGSSEGPGVILGKNKAFQKGKRLCLTVSQ